MENLDAELEITHICADRSPSNCHAWTHRIWALEKYFNTDNNAINDVLKELDFSEKWTAMHVSDFSGFHYRQYLFNTIKNNKSLMFEYVSPDCFVKFLGYLNNFLSDNNEEILDLTNLNSSSMLYNLYNYKTCVTDQNYENRILFLTALLIYDLHSCQKMHEVFKYHESIFTHRKYILYNLVNLDKEISGAQNNTKVDLNNIFMQQQCTGNIVNSLEADQFVVNSPKKTKHEHDFNKLIKAVINNEKREVNNTKYLKWCQFILRVPLV